MLLQGLDLADCLRRGLVRPAPVRGRSVIQGEGARVLSGFAREIVQAFPSSFFR